MSSPRRLPCENIKGNKAKQELQTPKRAKIKLKWIINQTHIHSHNLESLGESNQATNLAESNKSFQGDKGVEGEVPGIGDGGQWSHGAKARGGSQGS